MFKVIRINNDEYCILPYTGRPIYGDRTKTVMAMDAIGCPWTEIEEGLVSLQLNDHRVAHYGVFKTFIFSAPAE